MGRKGPGAKTKTVLKSVSKWEQFGSMQNLKFQTLLNKNPPIVVVRCPDVSGDDARVWNGQSGSNFLVSGKQKAGRDTAPNQTTFPFLKCKNNQRMLQHRFSTFFTFRNKFL